MSSPNAWRLVAAGCLSAASVLVVPAACLAADPAAGASAPAAPVASGVHPKAVMDETTYNKGDVPKGEAIEHEFKIKNTGNGDLLVLSVKPSCGCTVSDFDKVVKPGATGGIRLKIDTARFKGPISKSASVVTNDPDQSEIHVVVNATVQTFVDLSKDTVYFRHYRGEGEEHPEEVTVKSNEKGEFKVKDVQVVGTGINHQLKPSPDTPGAFVVKIWMDKDAPIGNIDGTVKVMTTSTHEPESDIKVNGQILGQVTANPSTIYFRIDSVSKELVPTSNKVNLRDTGDANGKVVATLSQDERLKVLESSAEWSKVQTSTGTVGWIANRMTKTAPPVTGEASSAVKVVNVTHRQDTNFHLLGTGVEGANLTDKVLEATIETVKDGQSYRVTVKYKGGLAKGNYTGSLVLKTSDKAEAEVRVPVYVVVS